MPEVRPAFRLSIAILAFILMPAVAAAQITFIPQVDPNATTNETVFGNRHATVVSDGSGGYAAVGIFRLNTDIGKLRYIWDIENVTGLRSEQVFDTGRFIIDWASLYRDSEGRVHVVLLVRDLEPSEVAIMYLNNVDNPTQIQPPASGGDGTVISGLALGSVQQVSIVLRVGGGSIDTGYIVYDLNGDLRYQVYQIDETNTLSLSSNIPITSDGGHSWPQVDWNHVGSSFEVVSVKNGDLLFHDVDDGITTSTIQTGTISAPTMVVTPNGEVHVVYQDSPSGDNGFDDEVYYESNADGFATRINLSDVITATGTTLPPSSGGAHLQPSIALDANDDVHVAISAALTGGSPRHIFYTNNTAGLFLSPALDITPSDQVENQQSPSISVEMGSKAHISFVENNTVNVRYIRTNESVVAAPPAPVANVETPKLDFGFVSVDESDLLIGSIENTGNADLTINTITPPPAPYGIGNVVVLDDQDVPGTPTPFDQITLPIVLPPGYALDMEVAFAPQGGDEDAEFNGEVITITTNDLNNPSVDIDLCGTTVFPARLEFSEAFGRPGGIAIVDLILENQVPVGGFELKVIASTDSDEGGPIATDYAWLEGIINDLENLGFSVFHTTDPETMITTILVVSIDGNYLDPGTWKVLELVYTIHDDEEFPHSLWIDVLFMDQVIVSDPDANPIPAEWRNGSIHIGEPGDVAGGLNGDGDGQVNILDIVKVIKYILQLLPLPNDPFTIWLLDTNEDEDINILDLTWIINIFLNQGEPPLLKVHPAGAVTVDLNTAIEGSDGRLMVPVTFDADGVISGAQASFSFDPAVMQVGIPELAGRADGLRIESHVTDGILNLIAYSTEGAVIPSGRGVTVLIPVSLASSGDVPVLSLTDVVLSDAGANRIPVTIGNGSVKVSTLPTSYALEANAPNPFNPSTTISYEVPAQSHIQLVVYNMLGQEVVRLVDRVQSAGRYEVRWDARNASGQAVSSGIYMYRLTSGDGYSETRRMTLLK